MKAIVYEKYGSPDVLELQEIVKPVPGNDQVLVKVHAASLNAADLDYLKGAFLIRLGGPRKPMYRILGSDIAGRIEAVGKNVTQFQPGDEVFGDLSEYGFGAFAEYVCVSENALALKPIGLTFEEAAAVPAAGVIALQGLRNHRQLQLGQKVVINGAGGGAGSFAVQLAQYFGVEVTGVDSAMKMDMLRSIGADHVIDYAQEDFTRNGQRYDLILDMVAYRSISDYRRVLCPEGCYVMVGGSITAILQTAFMGSWISRKGSQKMGILMARASQSDLIFLKELLEASKIVPVIDSCYPLSETAEAMRHLETSRACGKIVISVVQNTGT
ncbi:MAG TPA: NAD(P)-dependent alcohol dehydrogenase [Phototrophicaceae bacterium]|jgi:NADPH:quinone reductase-like Zn-dependent oxidoreductase|nr:NAD(P)-dependent alcohol dehydrogenase [Phototrophicaceae bacterium]